MHHHCNYWRCAFRVSLFFAILFVGCFFWFLIRGGGSELQALHLNSLKLAFFGFSGMNFASFIAGLIQVFIWGYIVVGIWRLISCCAYSGVSSHDGHEGGKHEGSCCK